MLTIDANVFVSASSIRDIFHSESDKFLFHVRQMGMFLYCPTLLLPEIASAIVRPTANFEAAEMTVASTKTFPGLTLANLTEQRAEAATQSALTTRLRGADSIYMQVAQEFGTTLITWDREMLTRGLSAVSIMTPTEWLAANAIS